MNRVSTILAATFLGLGLDDTATAADQPVVDPQLASLEADFNIKRQEARLEALASHADSLKQQQLAAEAAGNAVLSTELSGKLTKLQTQISEGLTALETTAKATQDKLDEMFAALQDDASGSATTASPTDPAALANDATKQEQEKLKNRRGRIPSPVRMPDDSTGYGFHIRTADWTRGGAKLENYQKNWRTGTQLDWKIDAALPAGKYLVRVDFRLKPKKDLGKATISVPQSPELAFRWPARENGRELPNLGEITIPENCPSLKLYSVEVPEAVVETLAVRQIILVPVDPLARPKLEPKENAGTPRGSVDF